MTTTPPEGPEPPRPDQSDEPDLPDQEGSGSRAADPEPGATTGSATGTGTATATDVRSGPRVGPDAMKDLGRLRRTVGPDRRVAGVAGGIARHFDVDPLLVRVLFVVTAIFGGAGILVYLGCWLVVPEDTGHTVVATPDRTRTIALVALSVLGVLILLGNTFSGGDAWPLIVIGAAVGLVLLLSRRDSDQTPYSQTPYSQTPYSQTPYSSGASEDTGPQGESALLGDPSGYPGYPHYGQPQVPAPRRDPRRRGPVLFWAVLAATVLSWGVLGLLDVTGLAVPFAAYPALGLALVGAGLLLGSVWGRAGGLIALGLLLLGPLAIGSAVDRIDDRPTVIAPASGATIPASYSHSVGDYTLDLSDVDPDDLDRSLRVESGVGRLTVIVPTGVDVNATGQIGLGSIELFGTSVGDPGSELTRSDNGPGDQELDLDVQLGMGEIVVAREGAQR